MSNNVLETTLKRSNVFTQYLIKSYIRIQIQKLKVWVVADVDPDKSQKAN